MKILILTRHFPPEVSGGVRRWFWMADALAKRNHEVVIAAPDLGNSHDFVSQQFTPRIIRVPHVSAIRGARQASSSPKSSTKKEAKIKTTLRTSLLLPDADIRWVKFLVRQLREVLDGETFDWVVTSSPPESLHYAGYKLKGTIARRWHADMRDYWLDYPLIAARNKNTRRALEARIAKKWLKQADLRTAVDTGMAEEMGRLSGQEAKVLPHFAPPNPPQDISIDFKGPTDGVRLVYTGSFSLSDKDRKIAPLLRAYEKAYETAKNLSLHIFGQLTPDEMKSIETSSAKNRIFFYAAVPAGQALAAQQHSDALIITAAEKANAIPGKLMEYRQTGKPIIAVGNGPWLDSNPDIKQGSEAMILASEKSLPASTVTTIKLEDVCDTLIDLYTLKE